MNSNKQTDTHRETEFSTMSLMTALVCTISIETVDEVLDCIYIYIDFATLSLNRAIYMYICMCVCVCVCVCMSHVRV